MMKIEVFRPSLGYQCFGNRYFLCPRYLYITEHTGAPRTYVCQCCLAWVDTSRGVGPEWTLEKRTVLWDSSSVRSEWNVP